VKVTKDMLDLAKHIVNQKTATFDPAKFEDHYESALTELINQKRSGKPIAAKARPKGENVVDLLEALSAASATKRKRRTARSHARPQQARKKCYCPSAVSEPPNKTLRKADKPAAARTRKRA
jgi:DNA end-binding protein Ku